MQVNSTLRYLRISPRKVRLVANLIRGKGAEEARTILRFTTKGAAQPMLKLLNSAIANAKNNFQLESDNLYISKISVDEGPKFKRWRARARGQAAEIQKKTSHINLTLEEIKKTAKKSRTAAKKAAAEAKTEEPQEAAEAKKPKARTPRFRPVQERARPKPEGGIKRIFRRKAV